MFEVNSTRRIFEFVPTFSTTDSTPILRKKPRPAFGVFGLEGQGSAAGFGLERLSNCSQFCNKSALALQTTSVSHTQLTGVPMVAKRTTCAFSLPDDANRSARRRGRCLYIM
jgi:hypothetical protein